MNGELKKKVFQSEWEGILKFKISGNVCRKGHTRLCKSSNYGANTWRKIVQFWKGCTNRQLALSLVVSILLCILQSTSEEQVQWCKLVHRKWYYIFSLGASLYISLEIPWDWTNLQQGNYMIYTHESIVAFAWFSTHLLIICQQVWYTRRKCRVYKTSKILVLSVWQSKWVLSNRSFFLTWSL